MPKSVNRETYLARAIARHGKSYVYDLPSMTSANSLANIKCPNHGWFKQRLINHLRGTGCPKCAGKGVDWIARFKSVHKDTYDYSLVVFKGYKTPVEIICPDHGIFVQTPDNHYRGKQGCPKCKGKHIRLAKQMPISHIITRAKKVHGNTYSYHEEQTLNMLSDQMRITCPMHGDFFQTPVNHLAGKVGCPKCNHMKSTGEEEVAAYLSIFEKIERRTRAVVPPRELDIYLPDKSLAVEYCGNFWHSLGDAESVSKHKARHQEKYQAARDKGIRLITMYEDEWKTRQKALKRLLRNAIGRSKGKLMARKCELRSVGHVAASGFFEQYHPQGGNGHGKHYGLYWKGKLVACMRFTLGVNDRGKAAKQRTWTLSRYATRITVAGAASRLFKAFIAEHQPTEVKSFSDSRYFSGDMYSKLGFTLEEETRPDYMIWSPKIGMRPKSHYQRRALSKRLAEHGFDPDSFDPKTDPRTEAEMTFLMRCRRLYDCGKKRWVWKNVASNPVEQ